MQKSYLLFLSLVFISAQTFAKYQKVKVLDIKPKYQYVESEKVRVIAGYDYWYQINGKIYKAFSFEKPDRYVSLR